MESLNFSGLIIGIATIVIIWFGRYACIKGEYYFTKKLWFIFLLVGILSVVSSLFIYNTIISAVVSIFGFTFLWGIHEIIEQKERVQKGWFPKNEKRK
jgi:lysylphosphatidylglycerol synthetase-like protein (DUF2156 family)